MEVEEAAMLPNLPTSQMDDKKGRDVFRLTAPHGPPLSSAVFDVPLWL